MYRYIISDFWKRRGQRWKSKRNWQTMASEDNRHSAEMEIETICGEAADPQLQWTSQAVILRFGHQLSTGQANNSSSLPTSVSQISAIDEKLSIELLYVPTICQRFLSIFLTSLFLNLQRGLR